MLVTVLVFVIGTGAFVSLVGGGGSPSWASQQGGEERAGFLNGCTQSANGRLDCVCVFTRLIAAPQYSTPDGFKPLAAPVNHYLQTGDRSALPAVFVSAVDGCVIPGS